jgi:hypothetical protein
MFVCGNDSSDEGERGHESSFRFAPPRLQQATTARWPCSVAVSSSSTNSTVEFANAAGEELPFWASRRSIVAAAVFSPPSRPLRSFIRETNPDLRFIRIHSTRSSSGNLGATCAGKIDSGGPWSRYAEVGVKALDSRPQTLGQLAKGSRSQESTSFLSALRRRKESWPMTYSNDLIEVRCYAASSTLLTQSCSPSMSGG